MSLLLGGSYLFGDQWNAISNNRIKPTAAARLHTVVSRLIDVRCPPHYGLRQNTAACTKSAIADIACFLLSITRPDLKFQ
jgi:hypothetical protein